MPNAVVPSCEPDIDDPPKMIIGSIVVLEMDPSSHVCSSGKVDKGAVLDHHRIGRRAYSVVTAIAKAFVTPSMISSLPVVTWIVVQPRVCTRPIPIFNALNH